MSDWQERTQELAAAVSGVRDGEKKLANDAQRLAVSVQNEEQLRVTIDRQEALCRALQLANAAEAQIVEEMGHELRERLQNTFNDLERCRAVAKDERAQEDGAFASVESDLRAALGEKAGEAAEEAKRTVQAEFPDDDSD